MKYKKIVLINNSNVPINIEEKEEPKGTLKIIITDVKLLTYWVIENEE